MKFIEQIIDVIYNYCTDFIISLANITGLSYYDINFYIFCIFYPALFIFSILFYSYQKNKRENYPERIGRLDTIVINLLRFISGY